MSGRVGDNFEVTSRLHLMYNLRLAFRYGGTYYNNLTAQTSGHNTDSCCVSSSALSLTGRPFENKRDCPR